MSGHCLVVMTRIQILLLVALPFCAAQFSIQGPSDGNRRAQGLKYDQEKGIQYDDQRASLGTGDFTIQGASDGNSDFKIQGATDGNSNFQIHGATDGHAQYHIQSPNDANAQFQIQGATDSNANFQIQGATDGHSQSAIQGPYDANQESGSALQYRDPSGLSVNWKSYRQSAPEHQQAAQEQIQYQEPAPAPVPRRKAQRQRYQNAPAPVAQAPPQLHKNPNFKVFDKTPPQIQQILQFQQQIPYLNIIPEQYRYDFNNIQGQQEAAQQAPLPSEQPTRSQYRGKSRGHARQKRQTQRQPRTQRQQHRSQPQHQQAQPAHAPVEAAPVYRSNVPSRIQELLRFQSQIPYVNHIPEQWRYEALLQQEGHQPNAKYQRQPEPEPVRHSQRVRQKRAAQHQQQQQQQQQHQQPDLSQYHRISQPPPEQLPHYNPNLPANLQNLLKFQAQTPYTSVIPEKFSYEKLISGQGPQQHRQKRQAPRYQRQNQQQQQFDPSQYRRIPQPQAEQLPQYSPNIPASIKQLLHFQSQVPYDIIANKINVRLDKPYVPQPVQPAPVGPYQQPQAQHTPILQQPAAAAQPQYQQPQQVQRPIYQPHQAAQPQYQQPQQLQRPIYQPHQQAQPQYQQPQLLRPIGQAQPAPQPQYPQLNQQSQLLRPQFHPNQIQPNQGPIGVRPVTESQY